MRRLNNSIFQGDPPKLDMSQFWNKPVDYPFQEEEQPSPPANRTQLAIDRGYLPEREEGLSNQEYMDALAENPKEKKPFDFFNFGLGMRRASAGASWLSGIKERNRQNQYLQNQLSTLGQLDALPAEQPNPYNLYAKYGGKLSKFANGGQEDPKKKKQQEPPKKQDPPKREPIIVNDKNDPRLRAYSDSLNLHKGYMYSKKIMSSVQGADEVGEPESINPMNYKPRQADPGTPNYGHLVHPKNLKDFKQYIKTTNNPIYEDKRNRAKYLDVLNYYKSLGIPDKNINFY